MNRVFNTSFELSLRALVMFGVSGKPIDLELAHVADFVATYGKAFAISNRNINGDNQFMFSEFAVRRGIMQDALKELVLEGYAQPSATSSGLAYVVTEEGSRLLDELQSNYASDYADCARSALAYIERRSLQDVIDEIHRLSRKPERGNLA